MVSMTVIKELNRMYGEYNYRCRLQDVSDEEFKRIYTTIKPQSWFDIQDYLEEHTEDREVLAHLKGFDSAQERDEMVAHIKRMQEML